MPVDAFWQNPEKTIYRFSITGSWTLDEFVINHDRLKQDVAQISHRAVLILDLRGAQLLTGALIEAGQIAFAVPTPHIELTVVISNSRTWQTVGNGLVGMFKNLFPWFTQTYIWVRSDKEALNLIDEYLRG